ncbi:hypothetical protein QYF36_020478 [Acer negundo]|nr:hypothetical protein QYF36_020478 [Acer negundo]
MKYLLYKVPVKVTGGLLFELLGYSVGDPFVDEDDIPIILRSWQAHNYLITVLHIKGHVSCNNVLGITEVEKLVFVEGYNEIKRLSRQAIRVKWSFHAREKIVFELTQHLRGNATRILLDGIRKSMREITEEQEAVYGHLFTIQDVMKNSVRAWLHDINLIVTHTLFVLGGCGLVLSIITRLFGINVDRIPGAVNTPYAFGMFIVVLFSIGVVVIAVGLLYLGLKKLVTDTQVAIKKLELQELVKKFQHEAETHAIVHNISRNNLPLTAEDMISLDEEYILLQ